MLQNRVGILGAGAVGHMLAFFCSQHASLSVGLKSRQDFVIDAKPVEFDGQVHEIKLDNSDVMPGFWFCALKAYALTGALTSLLPRLAAGSVILLLSNGYIEPLIAQLRHDYPEIIFRKAYLTWGVRLTGDATYSISSTGQLIWGDALPQTPIELNLLRQLDKFGFSWNINTCALRRDKWFYNVCLNSICGVYRLKRNGDALLHHHAELRELSREVFTLGEELWPDWQTDHVELWSKLVQLISDTSENENSTAVDIRLKRRNESEVLSGLVHKSKNSAKFPLLLSFDKYLRDHY